MARQGRGCAVEGCWRRAMVGKMVCRDHRRSGLGKELDREIAKLERSLRGILVQTGQMEEKAAVRTFRREIERGEYAALFAGRMRELLEEQERGVFDEEIGALRVAMMRLLTEENDPVKLALALSRVTNSMVRATKAQDEVTSTRSSRRTLEGTMRAVEKATRELTEEEALAIEEREWKRQVGWNAQMEKAWRSPENQRRLLEEGIREATERMSRPHPYPRAPFPGAEEQGELALSLTPLPEGPSPPTALPEEPSPPTPLPEEPSPPTPLPEGRGEVGGRTNEKGRSECGGDYEGSSGEGLDEHFAASAGIPPYSNELERLFWESPDPLAYQKELRRQMEEELGTGK